MGGQLIAEGWVMEPLDRTLRNRLKRSVKEARGIAEAVARAALE